MCSSYSRIRLRLPCWLRELGLRWVVDGLFVFIYLDILGEVEYENVVLLLGFAIVEIVWIELVLCSPNTSEDACSESAPKSIKPV